MTKYEIHFLLNLNFVSCNFASQVDIVEDIVSKKKNCCWHCRALDSNMLKTTELDDLKARHVHVISVYICTPIIGSHDKCVMHLKAVSFLNAGGMKQQN